jgi:hypothetical protein
MWEEIKRGWEREGGCGYGIEMVFVGFDGGLEEIS